jgi:hypothetical protein
MKKFIIIALSIFEFIFYTFFMFLIESITIESSILKLLLHFSSLILISVILYFIIHFILNKINLKAKKHIFQICIWNIIVGIVFPILLIIIIPNDTFTTFAFLLIVCTLYYGIFINICISLLNQFLTNRRVNLR